MTTLGLGALAWAQEVPKPTPAPTPATPAPPAKATPTPAKPAPPPGPRAEPWDRGLKTWERYLDWEALGARAMGADALGRTWDLRALPILQERYFAPKQPYPLLERYLIASALAHFVNGKEGRKEVEAWLEKTSGKDPWFAYNAYLVIAAQGGTEEVATVALDEKGEVLARAAALEALGRRGEPARVAKVLCELLSEKKIARKGFGQQLLTAACASAALRLSRRVSRETYGPVVEAMIARLEVKRTPKRIEDDLHLHLARIFKVDLPTDPLPEGWRALLSQAPASAKDDAKQKEPDKGRTRTRKQPEQTTFMGITAQGQRIVYLIDMSDSMLIPLTEEEKENLRQLLESKTEKELEKRGKKRGKGKTRTRIPWAQVHTRFDAVREFLKLSLKTLSSRASYAVIGFGNQAKCLGTTPSLTSARPNNRAATINELDGIKPGSPNASRKYGTLRGQTNLHAALRLAFQLTGKDPIRTDDEHLHPLAFQQGCDTVFLLSDGTPTLWDYHGRGPWKEIPGYEIKARKYKTKYKDPETGEEREIDVDQPARTIPPQKIQQSMHGPYQNLMHFRSDLERLNLFRKVTIHVVGVGEYSRTWLQPIVDVGLGKLQLIGQGSKEEREAKEAEERQKAAEEARKKAEEEKAKGEKAKGEKAKGGAGKDEK